MWRGFEEVLIRASENPNALAGIKVGAYLELDHSGNAGEEGETNGPSGSEFLSSIDRAEAGPLNTSNTHEDMPPSR